MTVRKRGPFFNTGSRGGSVRRFLETVTEDVADVGVEDLRASTSVFRNPTGAYRGRIVERSEGPDVRVIDDGDSPYGPWLEGDSTRNRSTRFAGYHLFRKIRDRLQRKVPSIARSRLRRLLDELQ